MNAESPVIDPGPAQVQPAAEPVIVPVPRMDAWEIFQRCFVVAVGIGVGAILALFIGLFTGWIEIHC